MADTEKSINLAGRKLMIAIPAYDNKLNIDSAFALSNLAVQVGQLGVKLYLTHLSGCSLITKARNSLVADFLKSAAHYHGATSLATLSNAVSARRSRGNFAALFKGVAHGVSA